MVNTDISVESLYNAVMDPNEVHWAIARNGFQPRCRYHSASAAKQIVLPWNSNGNGGRPYYTCETCDNFVCFGDMEGMYDENPACGCDSISLSRRVTNRNGRVFYNCALRRFGFFVWDDELTNIA
jgi:hypothetical protein